MCLDLKLCQTSHSDSFTESKKNPEAKLRVRCPVVLLEKEIGGSALGLDQVTGVTLSGQGRSCPIGIDAGQGGVAAVLL